MKRLSLILFPVIAVILFALFPIAVNAQGSGNVDVNTLNVATVAWGPSRADPQRAYDTASGELIFNSYEGLIGFDGEKHYRFVPLLATNVPGRADHGMTTTNTSNIDLTNPDGSTWSGSWTCDGFSDQNATNALNQGDAIYLNNGVEWRTWFVEDFSGTDTITLNLWRGSYTFHIRTTNATGDGPIYFFNYTTGNPEDTFDVNDAVYTFERGLVNDQQFSPMWMYYKAFFNQMDSTFMYKNNVTLTHLIDNAVESSGDDLTLNVGIPFPDNAFKQILSSTWGSIVSKEFSTKIGCWNGDLYADANGNGNPDSIEFFNVPTVNIRGPYDTTTERKWCGTGPYYVQMYDSTLQKVVFQANNRSDTCYWRGWPMPGTPSSCWTVVVNYVVSWYTRRDGFIAGSYDVANVPRAYMFEILDNTTREPRYPNIVTIKSIEPVLTMDAYHFCFTVNPNSTYIFTGTFPTGVPTNFFNNTDVRKAFACALNWSNYAREAYSGEASYRTNPWMRGLYPDYYNTSIPGYAESLKEAENYLKAAKFDGVSVWDSGFKMAVSYLTGSDQRRVGLEMLKDFFSQLSTYDNRTGPAFNIELWIAMFSEYQDALNTQQMPMFNIGWLVDFADADNLIRTYMHSHGDFASLQNYTTINGWGSLKDQLIDAAVTEPNETRRHALYQRLQQIYYDDCPQIPLAIPQGRRWCNYWVRGWFYNALHPSQYYYSIWKDDTCWYDISGPIVGASDHKTNMRDINYLVGHFNAKAPDPSYPDDPKWIGTYGYGGVDPYGDRICNMRDISGAVRHFNHATAQP